MAQSPWYAFYVGDYLRDTAHLSMTEHGAYRQLLDHYYSTKQPLPANAEQLHRICRAFGEQEQSAVAKVAEQFFRIESGFLRNKRVDEELEKQKCISKKRSKAAKSKKILPEAKAKQKQSKSKANATNGSGSGSGSGSTCQGGESLGSSPTPAQSAPTGREDCPW